MKTKLKQIITSFLIMIIFHLIFSSNLFWELGLLSPHIGLLYVLGLLFGPYGALGAALANTAINFNKGVSPVMSIISFGISFGVSYLAYKLWYSGYKTDKITKPKLDNVYHLLLFLLSIIICGLVYSIINGNLVSIFIGQPLNIYLFISYNLDFLNIAFIIGIICIWASKKISFVETPKTSKRQVNEKLYQTLLYLLLIDTVISILLPFLGINSNILIVNLIILVALMFAYLTKPFKYKVEPSNENGMTEGIMRIFLTITLIIAILGIITAILGFVYVESIYQFDTYVPTILITDTIIILFFIPCVIILTYIENQVIKPISTFSQIEGFIKENEKIETEGLAKLYSKYINEQNEIGTLARSYTDLITHNNNYIENIQQIEGEKERIKAELDIAEKIQSATLPTEAIENDDFIVDGYSKPAKEVGGDFFDYYLLDEDNLAIVIGDASGKGVPAALLSMITQVMIKQMLTHDNDPAKLLYTLNNHLCENNPEIMFLTLWIGIYNRTNKKLTFSNAGHNPPLIKENGEFKYLNLDTGIVIGVMEDFDYVKEELTLTEELVLYTDGITDANNSNDKMYGEDRLLRFFNEFKGSGDPIYPLLNEIKEFTKGQDQFDDMTLSYLRIK